MSTFDTPSRHHVVSLATTSVMKSLSSPPQLSGPAPQPLACPAPKSLHQKRVHRCHYCCSLPSPKLISTAKGTLPASHCRDRVNTVSPSKPASAILYAKLLSLLPLPPLELLYHNCFSSLLQLLTYDVLALLHYPPPLPQSPPLLGEGQDWAGRVETRRRERCSLIDTVCYCVRRVKKSAGWKGPHTKGQDPKVDPACSCRNSRERDRPGMRWNVPEPPAKLYQVLDGLHKPYQ
eukprot:10759-Heterococcus_DN1.PRE.1